MTEPRPLFEAVESLDGATYRLPRQPSPFRTIGGVVLILLSLFPAGMAAAFAGFVLRVVGVASTMALLVALACGLFSLVLLAVGLALLFLGLYSIVGRDELIVSPAAIRAVLRVGPLRWSRSVGRDRLRRLTVVRSLTEETAARMGPSGATYTLRAEDDRGRKTRLLRPYPYELVRALADAVAALCKMIPPDSADAFAVGAPVSVAEDSEVATDVRDREDQPASSSAILERTADGLRVVIPPMGFWRGSSPFAKEFVFFWCTSTAVVTTVIAAILLSGGEIRKGPGVPRSNWFLVLFFTPFVLIGIGGILYLINGGRRWASLTVRGGVFAIERREWFRTRRSAWRRDELRSVGVQVRADSDAEGGTGYVTTLRIEAEDGEPLSILAHRDKAELEWIATALREALRLPSG
jgi:hypothetical protein